MRHSRLWSINLFFSSKYKRCVHCTVLWSLWIMSYLSLQAGHLCLDLLMLSLHWFMTAELSHPVQVTRRGFWIYCILMQSWLCECELNKDWNNHCSTSLEGNNTRDVRWFKGYIEYIIARAWLELIKPWFRSQILQVTQSSLYVVTTDAWMERKFQPCLARTCIGRRRGSSLLLSIEITGAWYVKQPVFLSGLFLLLVSLQWDWMKKEQKISVNVSKKMC